MNQGIEIEQVITDGGTESRPLNQQVVKRYAVRKALAEFPDHSSRRIAQLCRVSPTFVEQIRKTLEASTVHVDSSPKGQEPKRVGEDDKARRMPRRELAEEDRSDTDCPAAITCEAGQIPLSSTEEPGVEAQREGNTPEPEAEGIDSAMKTLHEACLRVLSVAMQAMTEHPSSKSKVRTRLNEMRADLDQVIKGSLQKAGRLNCAA